jgi:hypothetical protein
MPYQNRPDSSKGWLWIAATSFVLSLAALYLGQGWPSLLYVVWVLGFLLLAVAGLFISHIYDLAEIGQRIRSMVLQSRASATYVLLFALLLVGLKLLGIF